MISFDRTVGPFNDFLVIISEHFSELEQKLWNCTTSWLRQPKKIVGKKRRALQVGLICLMSKNG